MSQNIKTTIAQFEAKYGLLITAPNLKWPDLVRWENFSIFDMQFTRRMLLVGHLRLAAKRYQQA